MRNGVLSNEPGNASAEKLPHNLARSGDDRGGNVKILQEQREPWKIDAAQVGIAADQHPAFEQGRFRDDERVVHFFRRDQIPVPDFRGDPIDDAVPDRPRFSGSKPQARNCDSARKAALRMRSVSPVPAAKASS